MAIVGTQFLLLGQDRTGHDKARATSIEAVALVFFIERGGCTGNRSQLGRVSVGGCYHCHACKTSCKDNVSQRYGVVLQVQKSHAKLDRPYNLSLLILALTLICSS